jgi:hypothetical protein
MENLMYVEMTADRFNARIAELLDGRPGRRRANTGRPPHGQPVLWIGSLTTPILDDDGYVTGWIPGERVSALCWSPDEDKVEDCMIEMECRDA